MQFVTFGNRIATENFNIGFFYKITFTDSTEVECTCIGIGANFVSFQRQEPELLFTLTLDNAATVLSIDFLGGGGTSDYEELDNKPKINNVELVGNKSLSDLGIQPTISDLDTIRSGAAAGATAVQPAALADYQPIIDSSHKLDADLVDDTSSTNKFATAAQLSQIETNKNNISLLEQTNDVKNVCKINSGTYAAEATPTALRYMEIDCREFTGDTVLYFGSLSSTDTDAETCLIQFIASDSTVLLGKNVNRGTNIINNVTFNSDVVKIRIYPSSNWIASSGDTLTFSNLMICSKALWDISDTYQPYAMTNAEITVWILSQS